MKFNLASAFFFSSLILAALEVSVNKIVATSLQFMVRWMNFVVQASEGHLENFQAILGIL